MSKRQQVAREEEVAQLWRARPQSPFLRWSVAALVAFAAGSWLFGDLLPRDLLTPRRLQNLDRFLSELRPFPLRGQPFELGPALTWAHERLAADGLEAALRTLAISVVAIVLAGLAGAALALPAARTVATPEPWLPAPRPPGQLQRWSWWGLRALLRAWLIFLRSVPEYVWAFVLIALLGPSSWPAILALAVHNAGILGKLDAEVVENLEPATLQALRAVGASRTQVAAFAVLPAALGRFLLFFFYRWETCVREATVLGMLGIVSLGSFIQDARARQQYDTMLFLILLGAAIVLAGDLASALARALLQRSR